DIDFGTNELKFPDLGFRLPFSAETRAVCCVRKVTAQRKVTLTPGQEAFVPVDYKPLPRDRPFMFDPSHDAAVCAVVSAQTPKVIYVKNPTSGTLTINKR
ncbi:hypothetical protein QBC44DRAFT_215602, partial [Cladorrhinum sp. PSN332]